VSIREGEQEAGCPSPRRKCPALHRCVLKLVCLVAGRRVAKWQGLRRATNFASVLQRVAQHNEWALLVCLWLAFCATLACAEGSHDHCGSHQRSCSQNHQLL